VLLASWCGSLVSYIYSAPPLKAQAEPAGWGNYALWRAVTSLCWWGAWQAPVRPPPGPQPLLNLAYSLAGLRHCCVNDFKSVEGAGAMGAESPAGGVRIERGQLDQRRQ